MGVFVQEKGDDKKGGLCWANDKKHEKYCEGPELRENKKACMENKGQCHWNEDGHGHDDMKDHPCNKAEGCDDLQKCVKKCGHFESFEKASKECQDDCGKCFKCLDESKGGD